MLCAISSYAILCQDKESSPQCLHYVNAVKCVSLSVYDLRLLLALPYDSRLCFEIVTFPGRNHLYFTHCWTS